MTAAKSAEEIEGIEYDWPERDEDGHVAMFSAAGAGHAPAAFLRETDAQMQHLTVPGTAAEAWMFAAPRRSRDDRNSSDRSPGACS